MPTALIVIDVQESFRQLAGWAQLSAPDIADRVARLVAHARARGDVVAWVRHGEPGSGGVFDPALGFVEYLPGLIPAPGEIEVVKTSHNAFTTTNLGQQLQQRGVTEVVICGIRTEQCCETTARLASDLGYGVRFVLDATATEPLRAWDGSGFIPSDQVLAATAAALRDRFAEIVTVEDELAR